MGRAGMRHCPDCGTGWPSRTSRYCGRCGALLGAEPPSAAVTRAAALSGPTLVVLAIAALVAAPIALVRAGDGSLPGFLQPAPDLDVDVPRGERVRPGLQGAEARAALAPWDPRRLRCEPDGCERWRVDLDGGIEEVTSFGELVVVRMGDRFVALDAATGARRWTIPVAVDDDPFGAARRPPQTHPSILASDDRRLVVGSGSSDLRLVGLDGTVHWQADLAPPSWIWGAALTDDLVVTVGPPPSPADGGVQLRALDTSDGTDRWTTVVHELFDWSAGQLLVALDDGTVARLDPRDGEVAAAYGPANWGQPVGGSHVLLQHHTEGAVGTAELVDAADGTRLLAFEGHVDSTLVHGDAIVLHVHLPGPPAQRTVVVLDRDGSVRWERSVPSTVVPRCCPTLTIDGDDRLHVVEEDGGRVVHDLATGAVVAGVAPPDAGAHAWTIGELYVRPDHDGEQVQLWTTFGSATVPTGYGWVVREDPLVVVGRDGLLGVDLVGPSPAVPASVTDGLGRARRVR